VDFPGDVKRRLRVEWLFPKVAASDASSDRLLTQWANARRGLLTKPPSGIYWMPFPDVAAGRDGSVREDIVETIAEINDEFRLMGDYLAGAEAFKHDLNVYVLHSWGSVYSWRPWGSPILAHLTDLPVRVHFISFAEVEEKGIPADAHALFIYGLPNTAWSGGRWWQSGKVAQAVRGFVEKGGGILALQAPSHLESPKPHWALGALLGVRGEGTTDYQASQTDLSQLADTGVRVDERTATGSMLQVLKSASGHWLTEGATNISGVQETVRVASLPGARVLYALRSREGALPGVVISEQGRGRVAYLCGWSPEYAFSRLVSRALFWVAHKENDLKRLDASGGDDLFLYGYPAERLVALASNSVNPAMATLYCDPAIFGMKGKLRLTDVTANEKLWEGNAEALAAGVTIQTIPRCLRLLRLEQVPER
jgi:1,3-beta-galactosyl-N-acetylhexosamine phosphorylase